jgi:hypothetical protein
VNRSTVRIRPAAVLAALSGLLLAVTTSAPLAAPVQWTVASGGNGHWYEYVPAVSTFEPVAFDAARGDALSRSHLGQAGYLATLTSIAEMAFVTGGCPFQVGFGFTGGGWLGGSDAASEGVWRRLDGPVAGQALGFTAWAPGRPVSAAYRTHKPSF